MPRAIRLVCLVVCVAFAFVLAGCAQGPTWVDSGTQYTPDEARTLLEDVDSSGFSKTPSTEATKLRLDALGSLRGQGEAAASAAGLIVSTFPADTLGVPVYVELARFGDRKVLAIVEAWGVQGGTLEHERLWVIDASSGEIIESAAGS